MRVISLLLSLAFILVVGCGYQLGGTKPAAMSGVKSLYIKVPKNNTQEAGLEADFSNFLTDALLEDTTYKLAGKERADAILETTISDVGYRRIRAAITDGLRPEELDMTVTVNWRVVSRTSGAVLTSGTSRESTRYFIDNGRLTTARDNAFPDGLARVSRKLVSTISNSF